MKKKSLIQQAAVLSAANIATRGLGFVMRVFLSRRMGAEITGVLELASSAHMLWIAPVTAGIPMAVATETAAGRGQQALLAGKRLALRICMVLLPLLALGMPLIVHILGDLRTLPALLCYLPCLPILALSAAVNGYCYGAGDTLPPASSELFEQALRFLLCVLALSALPRLSAGFTAAIPAFATLVGEAAGLWLVLWMLRRNGVPLAGHRDREMEKKLWTLSVPMTWMRLSTAVTRTAGSIMIPLRLRASGLGIAEATARLGMLNGMAMPWVMLPGVFTGALAMVAGPAIARRRDRPETLRSLAVRLTACALAISAPLAVAVSFGAPLLANRLYRQAEVAPLLVQLAPLVPLCGAQQVINGMLTGLERQRGLLCGSLAGSLLTLALDFFLVKKYRLAGCALSRLAGHSVSLAISLVILIREVNRRQHPDRAAQSWPSKA